MGSLEKFPSHRIDNNEPPTSLEISLYSMLKRSANYVTAGLVVIDPQRVRE
jgi:hypothetical protein